MNINYRDSLKIFNLEDLTGVTESHLKRKYFTLAKTYHPDKGGNARDFIKLREAYAYLKIALNDPNFRTSSDNKSNDAEENLKNYKTAYEKALNSLREYEQMINSQIEIINQTSNSINSLIDNYNHTNLVIKNWLDNSLSDLDEINRTRWWEIVISRRRPTKEEYIAEYNQIVGAYNKKTKELDEQFRTNLITKYQESFNAFVNMFKESDKN
jgi:hypothetical protein